MTSILALIDRDASSATCSGGLARRTEHLILVIASVATLAGAVLWQAQGVSLFMALTGAFPLCG